MIAASVLFALLGADAVTVQRHGVSWREQRIQGTQTFRCGWRSEPCIEWGIQVENISRTSLRCRTEIRYPQPNASGTEDFDQTIIVPLNDSWIVGRSTAPVGFAPTSIKTDCTPLPELRPLERAAECKLEVERSVDTDDYYPKKARRELREGPVSVDFTVGSAAGAPRDLTIIESSTHADLDAAALKMFGAMRFSSKCDGEHFRLMAKFRLQD